jgi:hypothetical protein
VKLKGLRVSQRLGTEEVNVDLLFTPGSRAEVDIIGLRKRLRVSMNTANFVMTNHMAQVETHHPQVPQNHLDSGVPESVPLSSYTFGSPFTVASSSAMSMIQVPTAGTSAPFSE